MPADLTTIEPRPPSQLDDAALLALVLDHTVASAATLLARFGGIHGLARTPFVELARARMPTRRVLQLHAALELGRRSLVEPLRRGHPLLHPEQVAEVMRARLAALAQEELLVLGFDSQRRLVLDFVAAIGSATHVSVVPADVLRPLLLFGATSFIIVHNHPSGVVTPSACDRELTRRMREAGGVLGLGLDDHVIVGREGSYSFAAREGWFAASEKDGV